MLMVFETFSSDCPEGEVIIQTPGMSELEREEFLNRFGMENHRSLVGFAVMGGIFGEGIDLVGERLSGAVVVGVGLPGISLEKELIRDYFAATHNAGFEYAYQSSAMGPTATGRSCPQNGVPSKCEVGNSWRKI
jgi:DNA excision repair protein ERCC-2